MSKKYDSFIDLAPGYESVIDLHSDSDAEFWSRYIVTDDMVSAVKIIGKTLRPDTSEDVSHFWLKGLLWHRQNLCSYRPQTFATGRL